MDMENSFLGTGWGFPPRFGKNGGSVEMASDEEDIRQSLEILLSTSQGERLMHPDFGCDLNRFLFEEIDHGLTTRLKELISDALLFHEPRIKVEDIEISESDATAGLLLISIDYTIRITNSRFNMVYPFYIHEAS